MSWQLAEHRIGILSANRYDNRFLKDVIYMRHVASHSIVTTPRTVEQPHNMSQVVETATLSIRGQVPSTEWLCR
jgi:hypothetical protein